MSSNHFQNQFRSKLFIMGIIERSPTVDIVRDVIVIIALSINSLLFFFHSYMVMVRGKKKARFQITTLLSLLAIFAAIIYNIVLMCYSLAFLTGILSCKWQLILVLLFYLYNKCSLYIFQLERLFMIFNDSAYKFPVIFKSIYRGLLLSIIIIFSVLVLLFGDATTGEYGANECASNHPTWLNACAVMVDIGFLTAIWIVMSRRLLMLLNAMNVFNLHTPSPNMEASHLSSKNKVDSCSGRTTTATATTTYTLNVPYTPSPRDSGDESTFQTATFQSDNGDPDGDSPSYQRYTSPDSKSINLKEDTPDTFRGHLGGRAAALSTSTTLPDIQSVNGNSRNVGALTVSRSMSVKKRTTRVNPESKIYRVLKRNSILTVVALLTTNISIVVCDHDSVSPISGFCNFGSSVLFVI